VATVAERIITALNVFSLVIGFSYSCCDKPEIGMHFAMAVKFKDRNFNGA
jgi:hypothetical protein